MLATEMLTAALGAKETRVKAVRVGLTGFIADVEPTREHPICSGCFEPVPTVYDHKWNRSWRSQDVCGVRLELRYSPRRVECPRCGVRIELVPWADPESKFTWEFEDEAAYLAQRCDKTTVSTLLRIAWYTVGSIIERVVDRRRPADPLAGLTHIGVDELSYRKNHEYLTVVVNLLTGGVVWAYPGKNAETLRLFFDELGAERCAALQLVAVDMSAAYIKAVRAAAPKATLVFDRFHVQRLVHDAIDAVRRGEVRGAGRTTDEAQALKHTRWALQKNPWNLTLREGEKLRDLQRSNKRLYRAYLLKESLAALLDGRQVNVARVRLLEWIAWALRSQLEPFRKAARTIKEHLDGILAYIRTRFTNAKTEGLNGKIRTITRRSFGFHRPESLIALIYLCCSGLDLKPSHRDPHPLAH